MLRKVAEAHHHTSEQVSEYVAEAIRIADSHDLSDADRAALLPGILTMVAAKQISYEQSQAIPAGVLDGVLR